MSRYVNSDLAPLFCSSVGAAEIKRIPTANVRTEVVSAWKVHNVNDWYCPICEKHAIKNGEISVLTPFCPNCGARLTNEV